MLARRGCGLYNGEKDLFLLLGGERTDWLLGAGFIWLVVSIFIYCYVQFARQTFIARYLSENTSHPTPTKARLLQISNTSHMYR